MSTLPVYLSKNPILPTSWIDEGGMFRIVDERMTSHQVFMVPVDELNTYHPHLSQAVRRLIAHNEQFANADSVNGHQVISTLDLLHKREIKFTGKHGQPRTMVSVVNISTDINGDIELSGTIVDVEYATTEEGSFPYVTGMYMMSLATTPDDLDARYPGWKVRYRVGRDLGLEPYELVDYVFTSQQLAADFPAITFE